MVKEILRNKGFHYNNIDTGMINIEEELTKEEILQLREDLRVSGLELMDDSGNILIEKIKSVVIEMVYYCDQFPKQDIQEYITAKLNHNYSYLTGIFSQVKGITIEQFITNHKIERIKELILYDNKSLAEIAEQLCYENVDDLSGQFEKFTGLTPSYFMELKQERKKYSGNPKGY